MQELLGWGYEYLNWGVLFQNFVSIASGPHHPTPLPIPAHEWELCFVKFCSHIGLA